MEQAVRAALLSVDLKQILLLVTPFLIIVMLFRKRSQPSDIREKTVEPSQITTDRSRKKLMEALGLPDSVMPPGPLSKKRVPPSEKLPLASQQLLSKKSEGCMDSVSSPIEEKAASQVGQQPSPFQAFDPASLRHAIVAREVLNPPKALQ